MTKSKTTSIRSDAPSPPLKAGRANQKRRTQQALMAAARSLAAEGPVQSIEQVAERALVSRATAYRHFFSLDTLLAMARFDDVVPALGEAPAPGQDPVRAIGRAADRINRGLLEDEPALHVMERAMMQLWLQAPADDRPPRPGRRMRLIDPIVDSCADWLDAKARRRLRAALAMTMGPEAVISLRDVAGASESECVATGRWAAEALLRQAMAEACAAGRTVPKHRAVKRSDGSVT